MRNRIAKDHKLEDFNLTVVREKQTGRPQGWTKLTSTDLDRPGAVNLTWDQYANILTCRVVTKGGNKPNLIIADLISYLLARQLRRIEAINILPR